MNKTSVSTENESAQVNAAVTGRDKGVGKSLKRRVNNSLASASLAVSAAVAMASSADALASETVSSATYQADVSDYANKSDSSAQGSEVHVNEIQAEAAGQAGEASGDGVNHVAGQDDAMKSVITPADAAGMGTSNVKATRLLGSTADSGGGSQLLGAGLLQATAGADIAFGVYAGQTDTRDGRTMSDAANAFASTSIAVGRGSIADTDGISIGILSNVGIGGVSLGMKASAVNGAAIGWNTTASGNSSVAIGNQTRAATTGSVAIGSNSKATGLYAVAFGALATAPADYSVALGDHSIATRDNTVSVGSAGAERQITNVSAGTELTDAVNVAQLLAMSGAGSDSPSGTSAFGVAMGSTLSGFNRSDAAAAVAINQDSIAYGRASIADSMSVAVGTLSQADSRSVAMGFGTYAASAALTMGYRATATGTGATALGTQTSAAGASSVALGINSKSLGSMSAALGAYATATADGSTAVGNYSTADRANTVSVGAVNSERQIVNVKAGTSSTDAVNMAQLKAVGMTTDANGAITNAFAAYDDTSKNTLKLGGAAGTIIGNVKAGVASADAVNVAQLKAVGMTADAGGTITNAFAAYDDTKKDTLKLGGTAGTIVGNVKAGVASADAVNVAQLKAVGMTTDAGGTITNAFAAYDDTKKDTLKLGGSNGTIIGNVKAGVASTDAVNVAQLKAVGMTTDAGGETTNAFVAYDDTSKDTVRLGGSNGTIIGNVKAGVASTDAVNVAQLKAVGMTTDAGGTITNAFVAYDDTSKDTIKLGGTAGTIIGNVKAGKELTDAVNVAQLNAAGLVIGTDGEIANAFVAYDDTLKDTITLGGTDGTVIGNVKAGALSATSVEAVNGSQLFDTSSRMAAMLGGGAGMDANGSLLAPTYKVGGTEVHDVGSAIGNLDGRVTQNSSDIAGILGALASGSTQTPNPNPDPVPNPVTPDSTANPNALAYDSAEHDRVTLGGFNVATAPVKLSNVADGDISSSSSDAVNGAQLSTTNVRVSATENAIAGYQAAGLQFVMVNSSTDSGSKPSASGQDSIAIGSNAQASGNNAVAIGANSVAEESNTVSVGSADNERRVTNVAAGTKGTDAANVNQLNKLREDVGASMRSLQRSAYSGVAAAMAMPNLMPSAPGKVVMAAGVGNFKGYGAFGAGATYRSDDGKWLVNGAVSLSGNGDAGARAQVGYEF